MNGQHQWIYKMAYPIKNTTTFQPNSIKCGDFAIGVNQGGYGLTSSTGFWNGKSVTIQNYVVYVGNGTSTPTMYILDQDYYLIALATQLGGVGIVTEYDALNYFNTSSNKVCITMDYPNIVANGLVLNLDAAFTPSYPRSGTTWTDISWSGNNATLVNTAFDWAYVNYNGVITFDTAFGASYANCGSGSNMTFAHNSAWSIQFIVRTNSFVNTYPGYLIKGSASLSGVLIFYVSSGALYWKHNNNGYLITTITFGNIYDIAITYGGSGNVKAYVNGVFITNVGTMSSTDSTSPLYLGRGDEYSSHSQYTFFKYNRELSAAEVLQNYYAGLQRLVIDFPSLWLDSENTSTRVITPTIAYDMGMDLNVGTLMNSMGLAYRQAGTSFSFDGVNNYIDLGSPYHFGSYYTTVSIWFKLYSTPVGSNTIIKYGANGAGYTLGVSSSGIYYNCYVTTGTFGGGGISTSLNVWHNVTMTFDGTTFKLYLDGNVVVSNSSYSGVILNGGSSIVNLGRDGSTSTNYFKGYMSIIKGWVNAISASEVLRIYTAGKPRHGL